MRGEVREQGSMFSDVSLDERIPKDHPLRPMRAMVDQALESLSRDFARIDSATGSIDRGREAPERDACFAEREVAISMLESIPGTKRITLGAERGGDAEDFIAGCRALGTTPHVAQNTTKRRSRIDGRTTRQRAMRSARGDGSRSWR